MSRRPVFWLAIALIHSACAHGPRSSETRYVDGSYEDRNRAPASQQPPLNAADLDDRVDPVSIRAKADYNFALGEAYSFDGQHQLAIEAFRATLIYDPQAARVHLRLAAEYVKMGLMTEAIESAARAVQLDPKSVDAHLLLAGIESTLRDYDKALKEYEKVLALDPENTDAPMYMGAVYAEKKDYAKATKYFEGLARNEDYPTPHLAWYYIGRMHADQEEKAHYRAAEKAFKKAIALKPDHIDSVISLGQMYAKLGKPLLAIELYKRSQIEHGPSDRLADVLGQYYLEKEQYAAALEQFEILEKSTDDVLGVKVRIALILIELKRYPQAADKLFDVLRQVPDSDKIRFYLAAVYEEMGETAKAIDHFEKVPPTSSFFSESVAHAAYLLKNKKSLGEASNLVDEAIKQRPEIPQFYSIAGGLWDEQGDLAKAKSYVHKGLEKFPENVQLNFFLGTLWDREGDKGQVINQMKKVLEMDPNHVQGLNYLAFTYAEMATHLEDAERLAKRALEIEPKDGFILDTYGWVLFQSGRTQDSIRYLERALQTQPQESVIAEHLGDAYSRLQLTEKARAMYQRALEKSSEDKKKSSELMHKLSSLATQYKAGGDNNRQPASSPAEMLPARSSTENAH
ncbi:MAG: hypothetical protein C5B49_07705 [Bdellovibrio sp.]|nr:MAG: hypothetical protein C5B49_07705 [Bdellovibrio sp.]